MYGTNSGGLPSSGLAEDILAQFTDDPADLYSGGVEEARAEAAPAGAMHHLVTFRLGKEVYGVEIAQVQEIIRGTDITCVPGAHPHVRGVINLRGKIIPVIDLRKRFELPPSAPSDEQRIVVVELGAKRLGMLVDGVSQVVRVPAAVVEEVPGEVAAPEEQFVKGLGKLDDRLIIILDLVRMLGAR